MTKRVDLFLDLVSAVACLSATGSTDIEAALLHDSAQELPVPANLTLTHLTSDSFSIAASDVDAAAGYCFELTKLTGCPRTELREDFMRAPELSDGWTWDVLTEGLLLSDGGKTYSDSQAADGHALKVKKATNSKSGPVEWGVVSPLAPEPIVEWSFVACIGTTGKSNRLVVFGRSAAEADWTALSESLTPDRQRSNQRFNGTIEKSRGIRQVRFALTAEAESWTTTGLDSLCVVFGGSETREIVSTKTTVSATCAWQDLGYGRYGCRVKAIGATEGDRARKDSAWSEEQAVDLAWADVRLSPPEGLAVEVSGDKLNLSWFPVSGADHYEVRVASANRPESPAMTLVAKSAFATVSLDALGDYVVTVTAVSPVGISTATAAPENCSVTLGKVTGLKAKAKARDEIVATWNVLPFADGYQAKLLKLTAVTRDGEYVRTEVDSIETKDCAVTYRNLDRTAKYVVTVTPQPSEGTELGATSEIIDLASEYFRPVGPVSIAGCKGVYLQRFDVLTCMEKETDLRCVPLEYWQCFRESDEVETLFYTAGINSMRGGVYCYSDKDRTIDSFMIGTVATGDAGSSVGLAFVNDTGSSLGAPTLTSTAVRRNAKEGPPYVLEWLVTDGSWSIGTESDAWQPLQLAEGIPDFAVKPKCRLLPGQVIIFRWRHEKVTSGPMLGLDNVHVRFPVVKPGVAIYLR